MNNRINAPDTITFADGLSHRKSQQGQGSGSQRMDLGEASIYPTRCSAPCQPAAGPTGASTGQPMRTTAVRLAAPTHRKFDLITGTM
jgi:hypothetical protein